MNLLGPSSRLSPYIEIMAAGAEDTCFETMKYAVEEAVGVNEGVQDIPVAVNGTICHQFDRGKVVDLSIMSNIGKQDILQFA